jgi:molybdopterin synthase catalytic subunit
MSADVRLLDQAFDPHAELADFTRRHPSSGGVASFLGLVRRGAGDEIRELELTHYEPLTLAGMRVLSEEIAQRWSVEGALILHRIGSMAPGDPIVLVAIAALHRREAILAVDFAMDRLKSQAWFWKRERTDAGWRWVEPRDVDYSDAERWD